MSRREVSINRNGFSYRIYIRENIVAMHIYIDNVESDFVGFIEGYKNVIDKIKPIATRDEISTIEKHMFELRI